MKFHNVPPVNGRQLVAKDVVYSFNRYMSVSPNKADLNMVDSVTASADGTQVTFKLKEPFGLFLHRIASFQDLWLMPQEFIESSDKAADDTMLGSGPFMFDQYVAGQVISWKKNPDYFEKDANGTPLPYLDAVNLAIITDQNQVLSQFAAGTLDSISVPPKLIESVKSQSPNAIIDQAPRNILSFLYFDPLAYTADKMPFKDERVRLGMSHAIDRDGLLQLVSKAGGVWPSMPINGGFGKRVVARPQEHAPWATPERITSTMCRSGTRAVQGRRRRDLRSADALQQRYLHDDRPVLRHRPPGAAGHAQGRRCHGEGSWRGVRQLHRHDVHRQVRRLRLRPGVGI